MTSATTPRMEETGRRTSPSRREGRSLSDGEGELSFNFEVRATRNCASPSPGPIARLSRRESEVLAYQSVSTISRWALAPVFAALRIAALATAANAVRLIALASLLLATTAFAQLPSIDRIDQSTGGQRGTEFTLQIEGLNLSSINDILFFEPGIEKRSLKVNEEENIELTLFAKPDCRLGEHPFVLTGPRGAAEVRTLQVDPFPIVQEKEPNTSRDAAQPVAFPATITGIVEEGDEDWFRVSLKKGQRLSAEVVALPLGRYIFDALLEIVDDQGEVLTKVDDSPLLKQDPNRFDPRSP